MRDWQGYDADPGEIEKLHQRGISRDYQVIPIQDMHGNILYFAANKNELLGQGAYGKVYKCYPVKIHNDAININFESPFVAKLIRDNHYDPKEIEHLGKYNKNTYPATHIDREIAIITDYFPGKELNSPEVLAQLKNLSFSERTHLITSILMNFNLMHHNTPATGTAIAHVDIKPENVLVDIRHDENQQGYLTDSAAIDFGIAETIMDAEVSKRIAERKGTPRTIPPEVFSGEGGLYGAKSDIFMISSLLMIVLGVDNPYQSRDKIPISTVDKANTRFDMQDILKDVNVPALGYDLRSLIIKFIDSMSSLAIEQRPGTDEVLRFFSSLHQIAIASDRKKISLKSIRICSNAILASENNSEQQFDPDSLAFLAQLARMHIIANGIWEKATVAGHKIALMPFHFESSPQLSMKIVDLAQKGDLTEANLNILMSKDSQAIDIARFEMFKQNYHQAQSSSYFHIRTKDQKEEIRNSLKFSNIQEVENYVDDHPRSIAAKTLNSLNLPAPKYTDFDTFSLFKSLYRQEKSVTFLFFLADEQKLEILTPQHFKNIREVKQFSQDHPNSLAARALKKME